MQVLFSIETDILIYSGLAVAIFMLVLLAFDAKGSL